MGALTITLDNEENTIIDLSDAIRFKVIKHPGSKRVVIVYDTQSGCQIDLKTYTDWDLAQRDCRSLNKHVIEEQSSVKVHEDTGSIVPV